MKKKKEASDEKSADKSLSRRKFMISAGNTALGVTALGALGVSLDFFTPKVILELPSRFRVGSLASMQPNSVTFDAEHRLYVFRDKTGYFYAVSAVCTHLGCTTQWNAGGIKDHPEGVIVCPCHGSVFNKMGDVLSGPAPRALDRFKMFLEKGLLVVDMQKKVSVDDMILKV